MKDLLWMIKKLLPYMAIVLVPMAILCFCLKDQWIFRDTDGNILAIHEVKNGQWVLVYEKYSQQGKIK